MRATSGQEWEFRQKELLRNDVAVLIGQETIASKFRDLMNKEK